MHSLFLTGLIAPFLIALAMTAILGAEMKAFLREVPSIRTVAHLARFKRLAANNMYAALLQIVLFLVPWGVYIYGLNKGHLAQGEIGIILIASVITFFAAQQLKKVEADIRTLPVEDPQLRIERDRVVETWMHKLFPDWR